jgi:hypothetical protein
MGINATPIGQQCCPEITGSNQQWRAYQPGGPTKAHDFVRIEDMWSDPMDTFKDEEDTTTAATSTANELPEPRTGLTIWRHVLLHQLYRAIY